MSRRLDSHYLLDLLRQVAEWSETEDGEPVLACQEPDGPVGQYTFTDQEPTSAETFDLRPIFPDELWKKIVDLLVYDSPSATPPQYVYVASSWRNSVQPVVCQALASAGVEHYDFKNPRVVPGSRGARSRPLASRASSTGARTARSRSSTLGTATHPVPATNPTTTRPPIL